jgi:Cu/Ag efflux protein CusF
LKGNAVNVLSIVFLGVLLTAPLPLRAQGAVQPDAHRPAQAGGAETAAMSDGEVRKVDKGAGKITLRHGPIPNLDMPRMTMVFRVQDPALLDQVREGDKVRFTADKVGGQYTVTRMIPAP